MLFEVGVVPLQHLACGVEHLAGIVLWFVAEYFPGLFEGEDVPVVVAHGEDDRVHEGVGRVDGLYVNLCSVTVREPHRQPPAVRGGVVVRDRPADSDIDRRNAMKLAVIAAETFGVGLRSSVVAIGAYRHCFVDQLEWSLHLVELSGENRLVRRVLVEAANCVLRAAEHDTLHSGAFCGFVHVVDTDKVVAECGFPVGVCTSVGREVNDGVLPFKGGDYRIEFCDVALEVMRIVHSVGPVSG